MTAAKLRLAQAAMANPETNVGELAPCTAISTFPGALDETMHYGFSETPCNSQCDVNDMARVTLQHAAELSGKARSTIHRAMKNGKLSFERDATGTRLIDIAELERAFGPLSLPEPERNGALELQRHDLQLVELRLQLELERTKVTMLEERLSEVRDERDRWRNQAERLLTDARPRRRWWQLWRYRERDAH